MTMVTKRLDDLDLFKLGYGNEPMAWRVERVTDIEPSACRNVDGIGDAVSLRSGEEPRVAAALLHGILQGSRRRLEKAEFIACPSCGRTLFDLEETTARIRSRTQHLKLKIGVMGCVVNGPGEMADADYGYVGWGEGKVALFVGRQMVERDIPSDEAPDRLVELIKSRGDWAEPEAPPGALPPV
ncbi:MAG: flavodoxin-dependent (E)-4-hydroxy-3-methylbut-2-enyl-diphosphate synthase [Acidobacteria bacterium]|nr:flavodoxin-dependent (E)-4-hydroxy-3-methylbut-2-enyl-diphosphate synthase [Acidobacteriota bacterium]